MIRRWAAEQRRNERAARFFCSTRAMVSRLARRWARARKSEPIGPIRQAIEREAAARGIRISRMTSRPFGFVWHLMGATYSTAVTESGIAYDRIG
jgi:hypothetical protein